MSEQASSSSPASGAYRATVRAQSPPKKRRFQSPKLQTLQGLGFGVNPNRWKGQKTLNLNRLRP